MSRHVEAKDTSRIFSEPFPQDAQFSTTHPTSRRCDLDVAGEAMDFNSLRPARPPLQLLLLLLPCALVQRFLCLHAQRHTAQLPQAPGISRNMGVMPYICTNVQCSTVQSISIHPQLHFTPVPFPVISSQGWHLAGVLYAHAGDVGLHPSSRG